jgi:hypothetical protein
VVGDEPAGLIQFDAEKETACRVGLPDEHRHTRSLTRRRGQSRACGSPAGVISGSVGVTSLGRAAWAGARRTEERLLGGVAEGRGWARGGARDTCSQPGRAPREDVRKTHRPSRLVTGTR